MKTDKKRKKQNKNNINKTAQLLTQAVNVEHLTYKELDKVFTMLRRAGY